MDTLFGVGFWLGVEEDVGDQEDGADGDGGIGDVEGGPRVEDGEWEKAEPDFEEVGDGAVDDAVREIAGGAAQKECESRGVDGAGIAAGHEQPGDEGDDQQRADNQYDSSCGSRGVGEKTEGDAGIAGKDDAEIVGNHEVGKVGERARFDPGFAGAVEDDHDQGEEEPAETARETS